MLKMLRMTVVPCLLLAGLQSLPASGQTAPKPKPPLAPKLAPISKPPLVDFYVTLQRGVGRCTQYNLLVQDAAGKQVLFESGENLPGEQIWMKATKVKGLSWDRTVLHQSPWDCKGVPIIGSKPPPPPDPDPGQRLAQMLKLAEAQRQSYEGFVAAMSAPQPQPTTPNLPPVTQDKAVAPVQENPGTGQKP